MISFNRKAFKRGVDDIVLLRPLVHTGSKFYHEMKADRHKFLMERAYDKFKRNREEMLRHLAEVEKYDDA
tara:strand:- start:767 stop:976 length:210 start_codon:yes stop_codon:yes gene_type:complete